MSGWIACVVIAAFAAERLRLDQPVPEPLVLVDHSGKRARVGAASREALALGVQPGMPLSRARGLCPKARFLPLDAAADEGALSRLLAALWVYASRVEVEQAAFPQTAVCYVDLGGPRDADVLRLAEGLRRDGMAALRLPVMVGAARGRLAARLAAQTPDQPIVVARGTERAFLAPFGIDHLPLPASARRRLHLTGLHQIGQFAALPVSTALAQFGKPGRAAHRIACGYDGRPVIAARMPLAEAVSRDLDDPIADAIGLDTLLASISADLGQRLAARAAAVHRLTLRLDFAGGGAQTETLHLLDPAASADGIDRALRRLRERFSPSAGITRAEVQLAHLVSSQPRQLDLFTARPIRQALIDLSRSLAARHPQVTFLEGELTEADALALEWRARLRRVSGS